MENAQQYKTAFLCAYTRIPRPGRYPAGLAHSLHLAWSLDGQQFTALHQNCGVLYARGEISAEDTIVPKGIQAPWLFRLPGEEYGVAAVCVGEDDRADALDRGRVLLWKTRDFIRFEEAGSIFLHVEKALCAIRIYYEAHKGLYYAIWKEDGKAPCSACASSLFALGEAVPLPAVWDEVQVPKNLPEDAVVGSCLEIEPCLISRIRTAWDRLHAVAVRVPEEITAAVAQDVCGTTAQVLYSDGSSAVRAVDWDLSKVDFAKPGVYPARGSVRSPFTGFPLAEGYADPVIFPWRGKYYFLATNDNTGCVGLFIREAESVAALFSADTAQYCILAPDAEKGFVQTFWAPELHEIGGELYILFAVSGKTWGPQCHMMRLKKGACLTAPGSWETPLRVCRADGSPLAQDGITLDMTCIKAGGNTYFAWSYRRHIGTPKDTGSMLFIAKADAASPWRLAGEPTLLSRPLFGWENCEHTINNEGPYGFLRDGTVYLCYSGGAANSYSYAIGVLTADARDDLADASVWHKASAPVVTYASVDGEYGPGHNSFFTDEQGNLMIAYHAVGGFDRHVRCTGIRRIHFDVQDRPVFDLPAQLDPGPQLREVKTCVKVVR